MSLLSPQFLLLACAAVVALDLLRGGARTAAFLAVNAAFVGSYLTPAGAGITLALVAAGYGAARLAERLPASRGATIAALVAAFVWLRRYELLEHLLPASWLSQAVATAGLSFLLFKILHVVIEAGSGTLGPLRPADYLNYCLNFTTFLLGPIQRFQDYRADWTGERRALEPRFEAHLDALNRVLRGLFKKFVLADLLASRALSPELDVASLSLGELSWKAYVFYFFLYFDFSGYCDVVIGVGRLMGVRPPENFNLPFLSANVSEYWLRVHRSLTTWLTDFVFNPLYARSLRAWSGRAPAIALASVCLLVTMVVSGLWHGTTLNFLVFGLVHAAYLIGFRLYESAMRARLGAAGLRRFRATALSRVGGVVLTFNLTAAAYVPFALDGEQLRELSRRLLA